MSQTVKIGTKCFVVLNERTYPGLVVELWSDSIKGPAVRVETAAAAVWRRPWKCMSFWMSTARMICDRHCELIVPRDAEHLAQLEYDVDHPPIEARIRWLAAQAGELPLAAQGVPQFPRELETKAPAGENQQAQEAPELF